MSLYRFGNENIQRRQRNDDNNIEILEDEIKIAINMYYTSNKLYKYYNLGLNAIGFVGKLFILVFILAFCYSFVGAISYIYVLYCFISIYRYPKAFKMRNNYISAGITRIKLYLFLDISITFLYQIPINSLHKFEKDSNSIQKILGIITFCEFGNDIKYHSMEIIIGKLLMFAMIVLYDNFQHSNVFKYFNNETLKSFIEVSKRKAKCSAYLYNNHKLWSLGLNKYRKGIILQNIKHVESRLSGYTQNYMKPFDV